MLKRLYFQEKKTSGTFNLIEWLKDLFTLSGLHETIYKTQKRAVYVRWFQIATWCHILKQKSIAL